jgi:hypothetical protein
MAFTVLPPSNATVIWRFLGAVRALLRGFEHGTCGRVNGLDSGIGRDERDMVRERLDLPFRRHRIAERA